MATAADGVTPPELERTRRALLEDVARGRPRLAPPRVRVRGADDGGDAAGDEALARRGLRRERLLLQSEEGSAQGWVPLNVIAPSAPAAGGGRRPALLFLHCTGSRKEHFGERMAAAAEAGYVAAAFDARYHGERAVTGHGTPRDGYQAALVAAW